MLQIMMKNMKISDFDFQVTLEAHTGGRFQEIRILHMSICIVDIGIEK